VSSQV